MAKLADLERIQRLWARIKSKFVAKDANGDVSIGRDLQVGRDVTVSGGVTAEGVDLANSSSLSLFNDDNSKRISLTTDQKGEKLQIYSNGNFSGVAATESYVDTAVANAGHLKREKVDTLPGVATAAENVIYMVPATDGSGDDILDEYMKIDGKMEKIGSNRVDLSGYSTTEQMKSEISTAVSNSYTLITDAEIDALT